MAQLLGYRSPRLIAMIEKGQRAPSVEFLDRLGRAAGLSAKQGEYLKLLAKKPTADLPQKLESLRREGRQTPRFPEETLRRMAEWQNFVLMQLFIANKGAANSAENLRRRLKAEISVAEIEASRRLLEDLGVIQADGDGYKLGLSELHATQEDTPSKARQDHHLAMMDRAREAMRTDLMDQRDFNSYTFRASPERMPEMKQDIHEFIVKMSSKYWDKNSADVLQLNVQLFSHTRFGGKP